METNEKERICKMFIKNLYQDSKTMGKTSDDINDSWYYSGRQDATRQIAELIYGEEWTKENLK